MKFSCKLTKSTQLSTYNYMRTSCCDAMEKVNYIFN